MILNTPSTLTDKAYRPTFGSGVDYSSKQSMEDMVEKCVGMVRE